jgi:glyoxylase-like metal-dependent hydrolase (beta-lactamase superfamily II)
MSPLIKAFHDPVTSTMSYVVACPATRRAAVIDSVLDYEWRTARTGTASAEAILAFCKIEGLAIEWILETHIHADHLSAGGFLKERTGARLAIGEFVSAVQRTWIDIYGLGDAVPPDGRQFDHRFRDGEPFSIGQLEARVLHTPGHTPACVTYVVGDCAWIGDTLFMPDFGSARCDFPGGDAAVLYRSIRRLYELPGATRLYVCHDYKPNGRALAWEATVAEHRRANVHAAEGTDEASFVAMRTRRDKTLTAPDLLLPAVQVNIRGGRLPPAEADGRRYLRWPLDRV